MHLPASLLTERAALVLDWTSSLVMVSTVWGWLYKKFEQTLNVTYDTGNRWGLAAALSPAFVVLALAKSGIQNRFLLIVIFALALLPAFFVITVNIVIGFLVWIFRSTLNEGTLGKLLFFLAFVTWNVSKGISLYLAH